MKSAGLFLSSLLLLSCKRDDSQNSSLKSIEIMRQTNANTIPYLKGCFRVLLLKIQPTKNTSINTLNNFDANCNFRALNKNSAQNVLSLWKTASDTEKRNGCLLAFEPVKTNIVFSYGLTVTNNASSSSESSSRALGSWTEILKEGTTANIFSKTLNQSITVQLSSNSFERQNALIIYRGPNSGIIYLDKNGAPTEAEGSIIVDYQDSSSYIAKYDGHVIENIPCK